MAIKLGDVISFKVHNKRYRRRLSEDDGDDKISIIAPVGKELLGKNPGDKFEVEAPGGPVEVEIIDVK